MASVVIDRCYRVGFVSAEFLDKSNSCTIAALLGSQRLTNIHCRPALRLCYVISSHLAKTQRRASRPHQETFMIHNRKNNRLVKWRVVMRGSQRRYKMIIVVVSASCCSDYHCTGKLV